MARDKVYLFASALLILSSNTVHAGDDLNYATVPEAQLLFNRPDVVTGRPVATSDVFRNAQDIVTTGNISYSNQQKNSEGRGEFGALREWYEVSLPNREDPTGERRSAWIQSTTLMDKLNKFNITNPAGELRAVRDANRGASSTIAPTAPKNYQAGGVSPWTLPRLPAAVGPTQTGSSVISTNAIGNSSAASSLGSPLNPTTGQASGPNPAPPREADAGQNLASPNVTAPETPLMGTETSGLPETPECAKSEADYKANKKISGAFENSQTPFSQWNGPNNSVLAPAKNGQWTITANGKVLRSLPLQICLPKSGKTPYFALYNTKFELANATSDVNILKLENGAVFTQSSSRQKRVNE